MDYNPQANAMPPSHYEHTVQFNSNKENVWMKWDAFRAMRKLQGWCTVLKAGIMMDLVLKTKPDVVVEIGVFGGKSVIPVAIALKANKKGVIYGIDPWDSDSSVEGMISEPNKDWWGALDHGEILQGLIDKIKEFDVRNQIILYKATSEEAPPIEGIDILHIDGNHSDETSYLDVTKWVPLMNSGGWIIFDDMTWIENGIYTQTRAVNWLDENCTKIAEFKEADETWGIWRKP